MSLEKNALESARLEPNQVIFYAISFLRYDLLIINIKKYRPQSADKFTHRTPEPRM